jgi:alginate O-acetyltransferase complex protein AlgI
MTELGALFGLSSAAEYFGLTLWLAAIGHFCLLAASFQVPYRLGWKEDLPKLSTFNRKLMWTYGGFTVLTIIAFGLLTFGLHDELLMGDRAALALSLFIGSYWAVRLAVDFFYFGHAHWPRGFSFRVGHALLVLLFVFLSGTYLGLVAWHLWPAG